MNCVASTTTYALQTTLKYMTYIYNTILNYYLLSC